LVKQNLPLNRVYVELICLLTITIIEECVHRWSRFHIRPTSTKMLNVIHGNVFFCTLWKCSNSCTYMFVDYKANFVSGNLTIVELSPWANTTTFEFTTTYYASVVVGYSVFLGRVKYFCFQNPLGYSWRCNSLQCCRCNSRLQDWLRVF
jgi:hypothetical protein